MANEMSERGGTYGEWYSQLSPEDQAREDTKYNAWKSDPGRGNSFYNSGDYGNGTANDYRNGKQAGVDHPVSEEERNAILAQNDERKIQEMIDAGVEPGQARRAVQGVEGEGNVYGLESAVQSANGIVDDYMNSGKNTFVADPYAVDPNAHNYGGYAGGAQDWSDQALAQGQRSQQYEDQYAMQGAEAIQAGRQNMYASEDALLSGKEEQSRYYQGDSLGLAQQAAYGNAPSVAQNQLTYGIGRTIADQSSAASSARGSAAMAMAQQNAMGNSAQALGDYNNQMAMLRAQEMATARAAYQQGTEQMRGQDQSRLTQSNQVSQFNAGQGQNEAQLGLGLAQLGLGYGNQGQGYNAQAQNIQGQQLQAQGNQQAQNSQNQQAANSLNSGIAGANAAAKKAQTDRAIATGATVVGTIAGGPMAGAAAGGAANAATGANNGTGDQQPPAQQSGGGGIGGTNPNTGTNDPYYGKAGY